MDWSDYYRAQEGRDVRATFTAGLEASGGQGLVRGGLAVDLGCGDGVETRALVRAGWRVLAIDGDVGVAERVTAGLTESERDAVTVERRRFEELRELPAADFVYAGFALPFCDPDAFPRVWRSLRTSLKPGGVFAGELFGVHDDWASRPGMNTHDRAGVERLLMGLDVVSLIEDDRDGRSFEGPKHWHVFHVVAVAP
jgi:SAM-dependent methyltransferase